MGSARAVNISARKIIEFYNSFLSGCRAYLANWYVTGMGTWDGGGGRRGRGRGALTDTRGTAHRLRGLTRDVTPLTTCPGEEGVEMGEGEGGKPSWG